MKNTIYKLYGGYNKSSIIMKCKNMNILTKELFDYFSLFVEEIISFERTGHTIEYSYKIKNDLNIKKGYLSIGSEIGGYSKEGIACKIK